MINWILNKMVEYLHTSEGMINIYKRLGKLENHSHPQLFEKETLFKIHKRLEDLETKAFVEKVGKYDWEGSD
tara:strand:+ start:4556 stop:4771 length:216 start_codon:yes stop_codon:yes gene_type:complete